MSLKNKAAQWLLDGIVQACRTGKLNLRTKVALWVTQRKVDKMAHSWKTTASGVATIIVALGTAAKAAFDGDPATNINFEATITAISLGIGLCMARDNDKSSEQVGAGNTGASGK